MSSVESLRGVVRRLADTLNDPRRRELSYFGFYDDSLTFHDFPPNQPANKEGFKQFIDLVWKTRLYSVIARKVVSWAILYSQP